MSSWKGFVGAVLLVGLLLWPQVPHVPPDTLTTAIIAASYCIVALSLVLLIGMVGQISLAQASFVGVGAFAAALSVKKLGWVFPYTLVVGVGAGALLAALIGAVALRVRGLYLAVATLIFAFVCDRYLFSQTWLVESRSGTSIPIQAIGTKGQIPFFDLSKQQVFYYVALAVAAAVLYAVANLRESRVGRAFAAIRGSEVAAASLGINVMRYKLTGFMLAGGIAGLGGALTLTGSRSIVPDQFDLQQSLFYLAIAAVGGLSSIGGAVFSALLFAALDQEVFFRFPALGNFRTLVAAVVLITVLLFFRGGLGALPERIAMLWARLRPRVESGVHPESAAGRYLKEVRRSLRHRVEPLLMVARQVEKIIPARRRQQDQRLRPLDVTSLVSHVASTEQADVIPLQRAGEPKDSVAVKALLRSAAGAGATAGEPGPEGRRLPVLLNAEHITVQFGGLRAVDDASIQVGAGEIVGLIGPNGAGKTTLFNSVLGLNEPTAGKVSIFDYDVTAWAVHARASLGVGRTFQILQLFGDITVFENLLVATHLQNQTGVTGSILVSGGALRAEHDARARVRAVLRLMDVEHLAERKVAGLPFGTLRLIEVARTLVTGARLVCFDEPASGLDSRETEGLIEWFRLLRQIGITLLVIEHDVSFVVRLCDYIYVLDQGKMIAHGTPEQIQRDPHVIASYLGTVEEAV